jgi:dipeptidase D
MKQLIAVTLILSLGLSIMTGCNGNNEKETDNTAVQTAILNEFNKISQIPRESGHEREISSYLRSWAKENGFDVTRDSANNVIIDVPATAGYEKVPATILQSNMDMTVATSEGAIFDPATDPIKVIQNKDTLTADGTSLGADSGIGMATIMYVLKNSVQHGPIRAIFTTDGESGMTGAEKLKSKYLTGNDLINLNWNSNRKAGIGSSGTASYEMTHAIQWTPPKNETPYLLSISGLNGGDAEADIDKGGANAIKTIGDLLATAQGQGILFELAAFNGGASGDTIPAAASALIIINESDQKKMQDIVNDSMKAFKDSYGDLEKNYSFTYQEAMMPDKVVSFDNNGSIISFIYGIINGVQSKSEKYGIVESASNLGMVSTATGNFVCRVSAASTSDSKLLDITSAHEAISSMSSMTYTYKDGVPRWPESADGALLGKLSKISSELSDGKISGDMVYQKNECGWFAKKNPTLQIVSIGPMIRDANTIHETLDLDSVTKPANILMKFLATSKTAD